MIIWQFHKLDGKDGDFISLGKAVSQFNKKINELQTKENKLYLPEERIYKDLKTRITTRNELNRVIASLRRFSEEGAEQLYTTEAGETITKWERQELGIASRIASRRLNKELKAQFEPTENGFSKAQMGNLTYRDLQAQLRNVKKIETAQQADFQRLRKRLSNIGTSDYEMRRAIIYRDNYLQVMQRYSHLENYDLLMDTLKAIRNPIKFYDFVKNDELAVDLTYQSDQYFTQSRV